jgi:hypothetical protein
MRENSHGRERLAGTGSFTSPDQSAMLVPELPDEGTNEGSPLFGAVSSGLFPEGNSRRRLRAAPEEAVVGVTARALIEDAHREEKKNR